MKRRREAEEKDTGDSHQVRRKRKTMENNFWTQPLRRQLLEGIVAARERTGLYNSEISWSAKCWSLVLKKLRLENQQFEQVDVCDLKKEVYVIRTLSNVYFNSHVPPLEEWDRLVYDAFKIGVLPPPPDLRVQVRKKRSRSDGTAFVNMTSNRTSTNTTNIEAGSCSGWEPNSCGGGIVEEEAHEEAEEEAPKDEAAI